MNSLGGSIGWWLCSLVSTNLVSVMMLSIVVLMILFDQPLVVVMRVYVTSARLTVLSMALSRFRWVVASGFWVFGMCWCVISMMAAVNGRLIRKIQCQLGLLTRYLLRNGLIALVMLLNLDHVPIVLFWLFGANDAEIIVRLFGVSSALFMFCSVCAVIKSSMLGVVVYSVEVLVNQIMLIRNICRRLK